MCIHALYCIFKMLSTRREVVIIGGGAAGCGSAIELAKNGWKVTLVEKNKLFSGSSSKSPGRMGLGFHYIDFKTSVMILRATIRFVKTFPGFRIGETLEWSHPIRHGRYFITKDSLFSASKILSVYEALKREYSKMVATDPSNMVFGNPKDFYRVLDPADYEKDVEIDNVVMAIETAEHLLDWSKFERHILQLIKDNDNITVDEHTELVDVKRLPGKDGRFLLIFRSGNERKCVTTDYVVNSTWCEIEKINSLAGFHNMPKSRTNRLKVLLEVRIPDFMFDVHSMFFCMGPFCMFSNLGNGKALISYAPETNIDMSTEVSMSSKMVRLLTEGPNNEEYRFYSKRIRDGATTFIPALKDAEITGLRFGIVQTHGTVNIHDIESPFHGRAYFGLRAEGAGWVSNPCMKLLYLIENGDITTNILEKHFKQDNNFE